MPHRRLLNIVRRDVNYFHGWEVCITRQGQAHVRYFRDGGDRNNALARAMRWRDKMLDRLPPLRKIKRHSSLNTTGVIGVFRGINLTRAGNKIPLYGATWLDEKGRSRRRVFSVRKYGERRARALAIEARREALAELLRPAAELRWRTRR